MEINSLRQTLTDVMHKSNELHTLLTTEKDQFLNFMNSLEQRIELKDSQIDSERLTWRSVCTELQLYVDNITQVLGAQREQALNEINNVGEIAAERERKLIDIISGHGVDVRINNSNTPLTSSLLGSIR